MREFTCYIRYLRIILVVDLEFHRRDRRIGGRANRRAVSLNKL